MIFCNIIFEIPGGPYFGKNNEIRDATWKPGKWGFFSYHKAGDGILN